MDDLSKPEVWKRVSLGSFITLKDELTLGHLLAQGIPNALDGVTVTVIGIQHIKNNIAEWLIFETECMDVDDFDPYVLIKIVYQFLDIRVYEESTEFPQGTKAELLEDCDWLFEEPEYDYTVPSDRDFIGTLSKDGFDYIRKGATLYGSETTLPPMSGIDELFVGVTEYSCSDEKCEENELMILERGGVDEEGNQFEEGGFVTAFMGNNVNTNDIEIL